MTDFKFGFQPGFQTEEGVEDSAHEQATRPVYANPAAEVSINEGSQDGLQSPEHVVLGQGIVLVKVRNEFSHV